MYLEAAKKKGDAQEDVEQLVCQQSALKIHILNIKLCSHLLSTLTPRIFCVVDFAFCDFVKNELDLICVMGPN